MANTYEALLKAQKEHKIRQEENRVLDSKGTSKARRPISLQVPFSLEEEYYKMKQRLAIALPKTRSKALLFSSRSRGEGATSSLLGFALTIAKGNERVLIVDSNFRNPALHDCMGVEKRKGFVEMIMGECTLEDAVETTRVNNLKVITAGIQHSKPFSLLESASMDTLIAQMKAGADWVLFDSSPINLYSESVALASKMDGIIMVVQAEKTRWEAAQAAKKQIEDSRGNVLGVILNRRKMYIPGWAYRFI